MYLDYDDKISFSLINKFSYTILRSVAFEDYIIKWSCNKKDINRLVTHCQNMLRLTIVHFDFFFSLYLSFPLLKEIIIEDCQIENINIFEYIKNIQNIHFINCCINISLTDLFFICSKLQLISNNGCIVYNYFNHQ